ncbi:hypothetical protein MBLNU230_g1099t1 [Neophaeotheca triangularis]
MEYLIRFKQMHETFRQAEVESLAVLAGLEIRWVFYSDDSPFAIIAFENCSDTDLAARELTSRSILSYGIYELWGVGDNLQALHEDIRQRTEHLWESYRQLSFRFDSDAFQGSRSSAEQREIIETFKDMDFRGRIQMRNPEHNFMISEHFDCGAHEPKKIYFSRLVAESDRRAVAKYNLKKRKYIATTSMDAELSLVTANMALVRPGTLAFDPFMGTGSFPVACAHFGATTFGSDMDGRSIRGKKDRNVRSNFQQYGTSHLYLDGFTSDLTNTPLRIEKLLDAIVCDPPYGVREGLKVLGSAREHLQDVVYLADGTPAHLSANYIPPKQPYSFERMLDDVLDFAAEMLVNGGRLCMWMPVADEDDEEENATPQVGGKQNPAIEETVPEKEYDIPQHPALQLVSVCTQDFNRWSRRLLTYSRMPDGTVKPDDLLSYKASRLGLPGATIGHRSTADELNGFRKKYFQGFKDTPNPSGYRSALKKKFEDETKPL